MSREVEARIISYRLGPKRCYPRECLVKVEGVPAGQVASFIGGDIIWQSRKGKVFRGKIVGLHGGRGLLRARFRKGLPTEAMGSRAKIRLRAASGARSARTSSQGAPFHSQP